LASTCLQIHSLEATSCMRKFQGLLFCLTTDSYVRFADAFSNRGATAHLQVICFVGTGKWSLHSGMQLSVATLYGRLLSHRGQQAQKVSTQNCHCSGLF